MKNFTEKAKLPCILTIFVILSYRFLEFVWQNSTNVIFWDQWDFLNVLFNENGYNLWDLYTTQHGPHRQGLGGLLIGFIFPLSDWNVRIISVISGAIIIASFWAALFLKRYLFEKIEWSDIIISGAFLSLLQYETLVTVPNPAHGSIPLLLIILTAFSLAIKRIYIKIPIVISLTFFAIYTGFSIFSGIPVFAIMINRVFKSKKVSEKLIYLSSNLMVVAIYRFFLVGYKSYPAVDCYKFPHSNPSEYFVFVVMLLAKPFGLFNEVTSYFNLKIFLAAIILFIFLFCILLSLILSVRIPSVKDTNVYGEVIFYLSSFTLIFAIFTAIGRVCLGVNASLASRYVCYTFPGILGIYMTCLYAKNFFNNSKINLTVNTLIILMAATITLKELHLPPQDQQAMNGFRDGKIAWSKCYLEKRNAAQCDLDTGFKVYPDTPSIQKKLDFLEDKKLNFFSEK